MVARLWLIGGTRDSAQLACELAAAQISCTVTVTTEAAQNLYASAPPIRLWVGQLQPEHVEVFLKQQHIVAILDASHPFATQISQLAIATAQQYQLPYLRYERPTAATSHDWAESVPNLDKLLASPPKAEERILLIVGSRWLQWFQPWQSHALLFTRILPTRSALAAALQAGFSCDRIVALRPPISKALEIALWQQWQITRAIIKASGPPGETLKIEVSQQLKVPIQIVQRPQIAYPRQTWNLAAALQWGITTMENQSRNSRRIR